MNKPVWNFFPFLSARYEVYREIHNGLTIEIYHHKSHGYNVRKMAEAMKKTVDYCNAHFSPYQYEVLRIVEFPRYTSSAQSYAGTIPFSESLGFILKDDEQRDVDLPFFITAHEVAHQWWGHQIMAADVKGKTLLVESLAEYTAFMVMLNEYGEDKASRFLKYEIDRYMLSRAGEKKKEPPLYLVDDQQYLSYQKGCLAFYNLMDFLGEDSLNHALSRFIHKYHHQDAPYPTSLDLLAYLRKAMPDSIQYLIKDWFETITLYDNRVDSAYYTKTPDGRFLVNMLTTSRKYQADSLGKQEPLPLSDWIEVGVFAKNLKNEDTLIYLKKVQLKVPQNAFRLTVDQEPSAVGIDPMYKQIDRNLYDNRKVIKKKT
jgi:aminopeptidase N